MEEQRSSRAGCGAIRLVIIVIIVLFGVIRYYSSTQVNPVTGEKQRVGDFTPEKEIALGLEAAPQMVAEYGGPSKNLRGRQIVSELGQELVMKSVASKSPYKFQFHLLDDDNVVNAFALPGGQIFITDALYDRLENRGQLAGVLGHEIGHVIERHSAQQMAKGQLTQTITMAAVIGAYDPNDRNSITKAQMVALVANMINMKYGRDDELESDRHGVEILGEAGYDPSSMIRVMEILKAAGGGGRQPEFMSTHPNPDNRIGKIQDAIKKTYPNGIPQDWKRAAAAPLR